MTSTSILTYFKQLELQHHWSALDYCAPLTEEEKEKLKQFYANQEVELP